jgi:hypothetical protein
VQEHVIAEVRVQVVEIPREGFYGSVQKPNALQSETNNKKIPEDVLEALLKRVERSLRDQLREWGG